jgi:hypothetical protein
VAAKEGGSPEPRSSRPAWAIVPQQKKKKGKEKVNKISLCSQFDEQRVMNHVSFIFHPF